MRSDTLSVEFKDTKAGRLVAGWHFIVHEAFRQALDIVYTTRQKKTGETEDGQPIYKTSQQWTEGSPPAYCFMHPDTLTARDGHYAVQVRSSTCDEVTKGHIKPGTVTFELFKAEPGGYRSIKQYQCTQREFVGLLRDGQIKTLGLDLTTSANQPVNSPLQASLF